MLTVSILVAMQNIGYKYYIWITCLVFGEIILGYFFFVESQGFTLEELDIIFKSSSPRKTSTQMRGMIKDLGRMQEKERQEKEIQQAETIV